MKCKKCELENADGAKFCNGCGESLIAVNTAAPVQATQPVKKKKRGCLTFFIIFILFAGGLGLAINEAAKTEKEQSAAEDDTNRASDNKSNEIIIDAAQFSKVSVEKLTEIMGDPESADEWKSDLGAGEYEFVTYEYKGENGHRYEFLTVDDKVVRFTLWADEEPVKAKDYKKLLGYFGVTNTSKFKKVADSGVAIRYKQESPIVAEIWATGKDNDAYFNVKITYDNSYFNSSINSDGTKKPDLEVLDYTNESDKYTNYIVGTVRNNTDKTYSYVQISINLYDSSGNQVGSALDNVNNLAAGSTWKFKAIVLENNVASYKIVDVTGF